MNPVILLVLTVISTAFCDIPEDDFDPILLKSKTRDYDWNGPLIGMTPPPPLDCRHPEKEADICGDEVQETCDHGALHDERCQYMRRVCVCKRGYVRPDDFNNFAPKGQCIPFDQCSDGMDKKKLKFFLPFG